MTSTFLFLIAFQLIGEAIAYGLSLPVPGPVIGMVLLLGYFYFTGSVEAKFAETIPRVLRHLSLFFIPAGAGIVLYFSEFKLNWLVIASAVTLSTAATLTVTAMTISWASKDEKPD